MTNIKDNLPIYAEEQIIYQDQEKLNERKVILKDFIELTPCGKSHSTKELELPKTPCWRYNFAYENGKKWLTLDIPQELMEKLDLEPNKKLSDLVFISPKVLEIQTECGGVTLQNDEEIFFASPGSKLVKEKGTQTNLNGKEAEEMVKNLEELDKKYNQLRSDTSNILYPEANIPALAIIDEHLLSQAQEVITKLNTLRVERNQLENQNGNLQQTITTLQNEITQLSNALQTTQQEKDQLQQSLKRSLIGSLFKNKKKVKRVSQLNDSLRLLRGLLTNKIQQIDNLTNNRNNLQTQTNDLNQQLTNANSTVTTLQEELRKVKEDLKKWTDKFLIKTAEQIFEELKHKNKIIDELNKKKVNKETLAKDFRNWYENNHSYDFFINPEKANWAEISRLISDGYKRERGDINFMLNCIMLPQYINTINCEKQKELEKNFYYLWSKFLLISLRK